MNLQPYIYGTTYKFYYVCQCCESKAMKSENVDGCTTIYYMCMHCGSVEHKPTRVAIATPRIAEGAPSEAWIGVDYWYNIMYFSNAQIN